MRIVDCNFPLYRTYIEDYTDCGSCRSRRTYDWNWLNRQGYGSTAWAPTLSSISCNFGLNRQGTDYVKTYD